MKFGVVDPMRQRYSGIDGDWQAALLAARLTPGALDHGTVKMAEANRPGIAIAVSELGMFVLPRSQSYFAISGKLYAGSAVLYGYEIDGATVDVPPIMDLPFQWLPTDTAVEAAIAIGTVTRPRIGVGAETMWRWPGPRPSESEFAKKLLAHGGTLIVDGDTTITVLDDKAKRT